MERALSNYCSGQREQLIPRTHMQVLERGPILASLSSSLLLSLSEAGAGRGQLVLLAGEAGGGKTTVVQQLCESVTSGTRIVLGNCNPRSTPRPLCVKRTKTNSGFGGTRTRKTGEAVQPERLKPYSDFG
jgi:predicted ATPase